MENAPAEKVKLWRIPSLQNLELLRAHYRTQSFPKHTHDHYAVGVIERGALGYFYRGEHVVASSGDINLCIPGEAHTGQPEAEGGWSYRMFYLEPRTLQDVACEVSGRPAAPPFFRAGALEDAALAQRLLEAHVRMEKPETPGLERETLLLSALAHLIRRHADTRLSDTRTGDEPISVRLVKDYLEAHYAEDVTLTTLSQLTGLSRYHLVRTFTGRVGVPPHTYLRQVRIRQAKALLASGHTPADVALSTGFTDQSHLTRWFKRLWGVTPGHYRKSVQDSPH
jgi:AraC-like DNA-binding protein